MRDQMVKIYSAVLAFVLFAPAQVFAADPQPGTFVNPLTGRVESLALSALVGKVVQVILGASGVVAAIVILLSGLRVIFGQGNEDSITRAKQTILWAVLGLVVAFGGYVIIGVILEQASGFLNTR